MQEKGGCYIVCTWKGARAGVCTVRAQRAQCTVLAQHAHTVCTFQHKIREIEQNPEIL